MCGAGTCGCSRRKSGGCARKITRCSIRCWARRDFRRFRSMTIRGAASQPCLQCGVARGRRSRAKGNWLPGRARRSELEAAHKCASSKLERTSGAEAPIDRPLEMSRLKPRPTKSTCGSGFRVRVHAEFPKPCKSKPHLSRNQARRANRGSTACSIESSHSHRHRHIRRLRRWIKRPGRNQLIPIK
jgi:hypothetical protein